MLVVLWNIQRHSFILTSRGLRCQDVHTTPHTATPFQESTEPQTKQNSKELPPKVKLPKGPKLLPHEARRDNMSQAALDKKKCWVGYTGHKACLFPKSQKMNIPETDSSFKSPLPTPLPEAHLAFHFLDLLHSSHVVVIPSKHGTHGTPHHA